MSKLRGDLCIPRLKQPNKRAVLERGADGLHFRELVASPEHVEEADGLPTGAAERPPLVQDDPPRDHGENSEDREHEL